MMDIKMFARIVALISFVVSLECSAGEVKNVASHARVVFIGYYTNEVIYDPAGDPHADGYSVELFKQGSIYFGSFFSASGMTGDTPNGRLEHIKFHPQNGEFMFSAKLTTGTAFDKNENPRPANYLFEFSGRLHEKNVTGLLTRRSAYDLPKIESSEKITLKKINNYSYSLPDSYETWLQKPLYNGPQW